MNATQLDNIKSRSAEALIQFSNGHVDSRLQGTKELQQNFKDCLKLHYLYGIIKEARLVGSDVYVGSQLLADADFAEAYFKLWHYNGIYASVDLSVYTDITPDSGGGDSESGGTVLTNDTYRSGANAVSIGAATVTFMVDGVASPLPSTDYELTVYVRTASGYEQRNLGTTTKFTSGFTVTNILEAGTLIYFAVMDS